uniref:Septin-8-A n=1 Tax=Lygus hesperus TaxID=30085 RepID=A0A0A9X7B1_LYGHE
MQTLIPATAGLKLAKPRAIQWSGPVRFINTSEPSPSTKNALEAEIATFSEDVEDYKDALQKLQATYTRDGSELTLIFNRNNHTVKITFNKEFEYRDTEESEFEEEYSQEESEPMSEEENEKDTAFHIFTAEFTNPQKDTITATGTISLNGEFTVENITPHRNNVALRPINTCDLEDETVNMLFNVLDTLGFDAELSDLLVKLARNERLHDHVEALRALQTFILPLQRP